MLMTDVVAARLPHRRQTSEPHRIVAHSSCTRRSEAPSPRARSALSAAIASAAKLGGSRVERRAFVRKDFAACSLRSRARRPSPAVAIRRRSAVAGRHRGRGRRLCTNRGLPRSQAGNACFYNSRWCLSRGLDRACRNKGSGHDARRMICADAEPCVRQRTMRCVSVNPGEDQTHGADGTNHLA